EETGKLGDERFDAVDLLGVALDDQLVAARADLDAEQVLEDAEVLVVGAEEDVDALVRHRNRPKCSSGDTRKLLALVRCSADRSTRPVVGQDSVRRCSSFSWRGSTVDGAPAIRSTAAAVFGNAMTSRIDGSPARIATIRSRPSAMPPWGGAPYSSASRKKPNRSCASSSEMFSRRKICRCMAGSWIRMLPPPISLP